MLKRNVIRRARRPKNGGKIQRGGSLFSLFGHALGSAGKAAIGAKQ